jgi:hypothetical protein
MANDLRHENATRDALATAVRGDIQTGTGANVSLHLFTQTVNAQTGTGFLTINLGSTPFGTSAISTQNFTYGGTATGTKTGAGTSTASSFAIYDRAGSPVKIIRGTCGTTGGTFDLEITNNSIKQNEKVSLTSFTYTASL